MQRYHITLIEATGSLPVREEVVEVANYHELSVLVSQRTAVMGVGDTVTVKRLN